MTDDDHIIPAGKLTSFVQMLVGGGEKIDQTVITHLSDLGREFVANLVEEAAQLASLKESRTLDVSDINFIAEKNYKIRVPMQPPPVSAIPIDDTNLRRLVQVRQSLLDTNK